MNILAVNGSPRGAKGNTERIVQPFLEGARKAGAKTEVVYLKDKEIKHCQGCFSCWTKTPGVCIHKDDMPELLEKIYEGDVLVFATPLYIYTVSGLMKDFMDRMLPTAQPYILERGHHFIHPPRRPQARTGKFVLISNAGFPERHHFSGLEETFRCFTDSPDTELVGSICCAGGELLRQEALQADLAWYLEAAKKAGWEVVEQGHISEETQAVLDRPLADDPAAYAGLANAYWESLGVPKIGLDDGDVPTQPVEESAPRTPLPPPTSRDTMRDLIAGMATVFNPQAAGDLEAVIQFKVTSNGAGDYYLDIARGKCAAYEGRYPEPTMTINTPTDVWMAISRGELDGAAALMTGKYSVNGNLGLLMRLDKLFPAAAE
jgi:multimeric flavodoxin WrbA/putative sterol carrier protein